MRRVGLSMLLAIAIILAGCPADGSDPRTLTPAPVPEAPTVEPTPAPVTPVASGCSISTPAPSSQSNGSSPSTPFGAMTTPIANGSVNASAVVSRHVAVLRNYRYRLSRPGVSIAVAQNRTALVAAETEANATIRHYVVDGRRHTYYREGGGRRQFAVRAYDGGETLPGLRDPLSVTGAPTIRRVLERYPHRVETEGDFGPTVLVDQGDAPATIDGRSVRELNSTVVLDNRGIVRWLRVRVVYGEADGETALVETTSLEVRNVGTAIVSRPEWVCTLQEN